MKYLFTALSLFICFHSVGQTASIRPEVQKLVNSIAEENIMYGEIGGFPGGTPDQWVTFKKLSKKATTEELVLLTDHPNAVVRCYAFDALKERNGVDIYPIILKHVTDTTSYERLYGCLGSTESVGTHFTSYDKLTPTQEEAIDSILLFAPVVPEHSLMGAVRNAKATPENYARIRDIYLQQKNMHAIVGLAKYHKQQDIPFIKERLHDTDENWQTYALMAVKEFPDSAFYPAIKTIHAQQIAKTKWHNYFITGCLYEALVQYKISESRQLIEQTLNTTGNDKMLEVHEEGIWLALEEYPDPVFDGLQGSIQLNEQQKRRLELFGPGTAKKRKSNQK